MHATPGTIYGALTDLSLAFLVLATAYAAFVSFSSRPDGETASWIFPGPAKRSLRRAVGVAGIVLAVGLASWIALTLRGSSHPASCFLIPEGYVGWVKVEFGVPGAPPLPMEGGTYVVRFSPSGFLKTSTPEQSSGGRDSYYYYSDSGTRALADRTSGAGSLIWGQFHSQAFGSSGQHTYEQFFVGTEQQFREQVGSTNQAEGNAARGGAVSK
jgi:DNA-binding PadR family transcriptional regulator